MVVANVIADENHRRGAADASTCREFDFNEVDYACPNEFNVPAKTSHAGFLPASIDDAKNADFSNIFISLNDALNPIRVIKIPMGHPVVAGIADEGFCGRDGRGLIGGFSTGFHVDQARGMRGAGDRRSDQATAFNSCGVSGGALPGKGGTLTMSDVLLM